MQPLETSRKPFTIDRFNSYAFSSSILIPVDTFSFVFKPPRPVQSDRSTRYSELIKEGDLVQLTVAGEAISTGYVTSVELQSDESGDRISVSGKDLMGFLEDNDAVNPDSSIIYANFTTLNDVLPKLLKSTRIRGFEFKNVNQNLNDLFGTNPGESKLAALTRFIDPFNAIIWMSPGGKIVVGRPSFDADSSGTLGMRTLGTQRGSNVMDMRIRRASAQIPNAVLSIWTGNESVQTTISKSQMLLNQAQGPSRLYQAGHRMYRTIVTSAPAGSDVTTGTDLQRLLIQGSNFLGSLAQREIARENINELLVSCTVYGHLNDEGDPYAADQVYHCVHDGDGLDENMYLYAVDYTMSEGAGYVTTLQLCKLNTIVADSPAGGSAGSGASLGNIA